MEQADVNEFALRVEQIRQNLDGIHTAVARQQKVFEYMALREINGSLSSYGETLDRQLALKSELWPIPKRGA